MHDNIRHKKFIDSLAGADPGGRAHGAPPHPPKIEKNMIF
jgi:hypothetical protein